MKKSILIALAVSVHMSALGVIIDRRGLVPSVAHEYRAKAPTFTSLEHELLYWIKEHNAEHVERVLQRGVTLTVAEHPAQGVSAVTPLMWASMVGNPDIVAELLQSGAPVNQHINGETALAAACAWGNVDTVRLLLTHGADPISYNAKGMTPLLEASHIHYAHGFTKKEAEQRRADIMELLLDHMGTHDAQIRSQYVNTIDPEHRTVALMFAPTQPLTNKLLDHGAAVNIPCGHRETPLHVACGWGRWKLANALLDRGAQVNATTDKGETPLTYLLKHKDDSPKKAALLERLLTHGARVDVVDSEGDSVFKLAAHSPRLLDILSRYSSHRILETSDAHGRTALLAAAHELNEQSFYKLLDNGAEILRADNYDCSVVHILLIAYQNLYREYHERLEEWGNRLNLSPEHKATVEYYRKPLEATRRMLLRAFDELEKHVQGNKAEAVALLMNYGARDDGKTPLMSAAASGDVEMVTRILKIPGVDPTRTNRYEPAVASTFARREGYDHIADHLEAITN